MNQKIILCGEDQKDRLLTYLREEPVRNTFLIGDIINYGFTSDVQQVWADFEQQECEAVYLWFCKNLLIYSHNQHLNLESLETIISMKKPDQIMAKRSHLEQIQPLLKGYEIRSKQLLGLDSELEIPEEDQNLGLGQGEQVRIAQLSDVDTIYEFLQSGELGPLYRAKEMIEKRIETQEGVHYLIERDGALIGQINSAASTPDSTMIGGLFVKPEFRGHGRGRYLVRKLCENIQGSGRIPCLISTADENKNLFYELGFQWIGEFTTLEPQK